jgi:hypothetical protein
MLIPMRAMTAIKYMPSFSQRLSSTLSIGPIAQVVRAADS